MDEIKINDHLDTGWVVIDDIEDVDEAEEDRDQQAHPPRHNLPWKSSYCELYRKSSYNPLWQRGVHTTTQVKVTSTDVQK